ncbi:calcium homeostasis endoplasmic reticulum protein [Diaphorina citri]|uniref:Calcium homeostasis endoplasmic reticulum protein n=1 Tax=Diaphorina citri TaxID=121845 RepID=A0A1S4ESL6_DIACI|nr:calcium homeostasis endoplasmic reticulum protein [Diaphorina citri]
MDLPKPPPDVESKNIIDKLAQFVARNGPEFEQMTKEKQAGNAKFAFLFGGEYFNYYQYRVTSEQLNRPSKDCPTTVPPSNVTVEALTQQQSALNEQIQQSESNLKAQHEVLKLQEDAKVDETIQKTQLASFTDEANTLNISLETLDSMLQPIMDTCTKDSISSGKAWILQRAVDEKSNTFFTKYLLYKVLNASSFLHKLHIIYLVNDILHHCVRKNVPELKKSVEDVVVPMFCNVAKDATEEQQVKLNKLLTLWESKNHYFSAEIVAKLKEPRRSWYEYRRGLLNTYSIVLQPTLTLTKSTYSNYQSQHEAFVQHAISQIQTLEEQKTALLQQNLGAKEQGIEAPISGGEKYLAHIIFNSRNIPVYLAKYIHGGSPKARRQRIWITIMKPAGTVFHGEYNWVSDGPLYDSGFIDNDGLLKKNLHPVILHNFPLNVRKNVPELKKSVEDVVVPMFCNVAKDATEEQQVKLNKLLTLWESKNHYFSAEIVAKLKEPRRSWYEYRRGLLNTYSIVLQPTLTLTKSTYSNYQSQHEAFVQHAISQIQTLEEQKTALLQQKALATMMSVLPSSVAQTDVQLPDFSRPPPGFAPPAMMGSGGGGGQGPAPPPPAEIMREELLPSLPYYDLPAGLMVPLIKLEDSNYKPLDRKKIRLPPPTPPSDRLIQAVKAFYAPPGHDSPRDSEGWEKLGLYEYYRAKTCARRQKEEEIESGRRERTPPPSPVIREKTKSPTPPPRKRYTSPSIIYLPWWSNNQDARLGAKEQGIEAPISGGEVREREDLYKGVGVSLNDPYENFRKSKKQAFISRMKERQEHTRGAE